MFYKLKRHPVAMAAHFRHCLVLTYALPQEILLPLLPPGLELDTFNQYAFVAVAMVKAEAMRPRAMPRQLGQDFMLTGYRIFTRFPKRSGASQRGLRILRSDCDSRLMAVAGNLLTHYHYHIADISMQEMGGDLDVRVLSRDNRADLDLTAQLDESHAGLPESSVFPDLQTAQRFAGPLPFTFDYESKTNSIVAIKGVRTKWNPRPVSVIVRKCTFMHQPLFNEVQPVLSNAFYVDDIPYSWNSGTLHRLPCNTMRQGSISI